ncbi:23S rRNA (pseudouridine(1915)-N(3))-methyltransferase RlmH [Rubellicoccus peritrichatus]|uniref:Ribosomal RNA large subunit methyltransferase H n=1 Tax=Rubellicoccus peritrichatus TaxID=3080537 RepID=A0AAQ3QS02_9BACT|nr:23S rRNA (pseudouridine(1915)-N(3))-methyltransferase RlmH [Puniceicoccus sp. CR14]WOO41858.1 23S rRNA (pseudouridine(1915)-N(3))-methyltransferase RlmH [Puniceicoccus sp. CR14]
MQITLLAVGKLKNPHWKSLASDYTARINRQDRIDTIEIKDTTPAKEGERFQESLAKTNKAKVFVLSEEGKTLSSRKLAERFDQNLGAPLCFIIGGPYGLSPEIKSAGELISLSPMTFTHEMARVILLEQIYRALSINSGSGYHH